VAQAGGIVTDQQQAAGDALPTIVRDRTRAWVDVPLDSLYALRLRRFGAHWDFDSARWWVGIAKAHALEHLVGLPLGSPQDEPEQQQAGQQQSAAKVLVELAIEQYSLGVTEIGEPYGTHRDTPHIGMMLRGGKAGLRAELSRRYWEVHQTPPPQQALADACMVLEGLAAQENSQRVYLRVAERGGSVYIDMGDTDGHVIDISGGTWDIGVSAPVLFRRTKLTGEMSRPYADGNVSRLWEFVPIGEVDRPLVLAWLTQALLQPDTAHPVLSLIAEMGSAKSTITRCLVDLIDPSPVPLRKVPRDADAWVTAANASWTVALDNLSGEIPQWLSDSLCRAVTGDGDVRRALYTDQDVSVIAFRRAVIVNGIDIEVTQGDLADRMLRVDLPRVTNRRDDAELAEAWAEARPDILGGLLNLVANVHYRLPTVTVTSPPRMADYAKVLHAVDLIDGTGGLTRYREQSKRAAADTLDAPFIAEMVACNYGCAAETSAQILAALKPADPAWKQPKGWPVNSRAVTGQLTRHAPALRAQGWEIDHDDSQNKACVRRWTICPPEKDRISNLPNLPDLPAQVNGYKSGRLETCETLQDGELFPAGREDVEQAGQAKSANLPENVTATSSDRSAGQAGQEYGPSLVAAGNGTTDGTGYRRQGCVCIGQPKPCYHCQNLASKQQDGAK
jgi:hypothetical protein